MAGGYHFGQHKLWNSSNITESSTLRYQSEGKPAENLQDRNSVCDKKETYKRRSLSPPSLFLLWKWYCEDMIHGTEAGLLRPQGRKHKGKLQNHRKKWKAPPKKNWVPEVIVELPLKPLDLFLLIMNILWFKPLLLWFPSAYNSAWHIEEVQSICWFLKFKSYSFLCSKHLTQFFIYISWWVLSRLTNVQSSKQMEMCNIMIKLTAGKNSNF